MRETHLLCNAFGSLFMVCVAVPVHKHHSHAAQPSRVVLEQLLFQQRFVQRLQQLALGTDALMGFQHCAVKQLWQHDMAVK